MNPEKQHRVCPVAKAGMLDHVLRKLIQDPARILRPHVREGMAVLDVGCGPGFFTLEMARLVGEGGRVTAADLQPGMLDLVRKKLAASGLAGRAAFHQCGADAIGLPAGNGFDFILVFYMLHEVPEPGSFLRELKSLLKPGGRVLVVEPRWHVGHGGFQDAIGLMKQAGFAVLAEPAVRLSRAVLIGDPGRN